MDNHHFMLKVSRLFPSSFTSCHFRTLPDVAENSITTKILHENDLSAPFSKPPNPKKILPISSSVPKFCKRNLISAHSPDAQGRKCPPKTEKLLKEKNPLFSVTHSSTSNSAWFTSGDDVGSDTFFSISSNSGDSFRLKSGRIFRKCEEMKSIDETGRRSYETVASADTNLSKCSHGTAAKGSRRSGKTWPEIELGSDHISAQMYYNDTGGSERRRKIGKSRRKPKKRESRRSLDYRSVIGESYAVEKSSVDPRADFRASMVEMIVEKQIFAAEDLERLLLCFVSLNAVSYHGIIIDVFSEICQTLFSN
ncbi:hypothetical protein ACS0TY_012241 [Phlomoides rotata]